MQQLLFVILLFLVLLLPPATTHASPPGAGGGGGDAKGLRVFQLGSAYNLDPDPKAGSLVALASLLDVVHPDVYRTPVRNGVGGRPPSGGFTALMAAAERGHTDVVRLLLEHGADVTATDASGVATALSKAKPGSAVYALLWEATASAKDAADGATMPTQRQQQQQQQQMHADAGHTTELRLSARSEHIAKYRASAARTAAADSIAAAATFAAAAAAVRPGSANEGGRLFRAIKSFAQQREEARMATSKRKKQSRQFQNEQQSLPGSAGSSAEDDTDTSAAETAWEAKEEQLCESTLLPLLRPRPSPGAYTLLFGTQCGCGNRAARNDRSESEDEAKFEVEAKFEDDNGCSASDTDFGAGRGPVERGVPPDAYDDGSGLTALQVGAASCDLAPAPQIIVMRAHDRSYILLP